MQSSTCFMILGSAEVLFPLLIMMTLIFVVMLTSVSVYAKMLKKVTKGFAGVRTGAGGTEVGFDRLVVFPIFHRYEEVDISIKRVDVERSLLCRDQIQADVKAVFFVRINNTPADVDKAVSSMGCNPASSEAEICALFDPLFAKALREAAKQFDFDELYEERQTFKEAVIKGIGYDLNGFIIDEFAIDHLEQTAVDYNSLSGTHEGMAYHGFWEGETQGLENLTLLIIANYAKSKNPRLSKWLYGSNNELPPGPTGYFDYNGEVVTFALLKFDTLLILNQYFTIEGPPIVSITRDLSDQLQVELVPKNSALVSSLFDDIKKAGK